MMMRSLFGRGKKRRDPVAPAPDESIRAARLGDVLTINGFSVEYDERLFFIERIHRYSSSADTWHELLCVEGDDRLWIDWTDGRELSVTVTEDTGPAGLTATGLTEDDLIQLDEEQFHRQLRDHRWRKLLLSKQRRGAVLPGQQGAWRCLLPVGFHQGAGRYGPDHNQVGGRPFEVVFSKAIAPESISLYQGERRHS